MIVEIATDGKRFNADRRLTVSWGVSRIGTENRRKCYTTSSSEAGGPESLRYTLGSLELDV
jgi:hypothetical protein